MDFEDGLYLTASVLIGIGAGWLSVGAGFIAFGVMLAIPPLLSLFRGRKGGKSE